jgi:hypothetical protein
MNVGLLRSLVAAGQQDDQQRLALHEINAVTRPVIYPQLRNAPSDRSHISRIADGQAIDPRLYSHSHLSVSEALEPVYEGFGLPNFNQRLSLVRDNMSIGSRHPITFAARNSASVA